MRQHLLTIIVKNQSEIIYNQRVNLKGNYIIGRLKIRCDEMLLAFNSHTSVITLPQANRHLSGFHCVLVENKEGYQIIDGWGQYKSTNGIYKSNYRIQFDYLFNGDEIFLGSREVILKYESERNITEDEKKTLSQVFEV